MRIFCLLFFTFLIGITNFVHSQESAIVPGNLLIMLNSDGDVSRISQELYYLNGIKTELRMERELSRTMHIYLFNFNSAIIDPIQLLNAVKKDPSVKIAQFNHTFKERIIPNDPKFSVMWDMNNTGQNGGVVDADIDAPEAWNITTGGVTALGDSIVVAVIDGGFDLAQQDLNFWKNYKEIPNNGIDDDGNGYIDDYNGWNGEAGNDNLAVAQHGTHVCGTVGAKGNNGIGVTGVNWNVKIMAVSYGSGSSLEADAVASYAYVRDQRKLYNQTNGAKGAFVVSTNSSFGVDLGMPASYPLWCAMYDSLGAVGILSAAATANANYNVDVQGDIPTACASNWLITVTNTTNTDVKFPGGAGYGTTTIDLGAPGTNITSTVPSNGYASLTGTSMATPHVAGAVALMYSLPCSPLITNYKSDPAGVALIVKDSLLKTTDPNAALSGITVSSGRLNLYKAVNAMHNYCDCYAYNTTHLTLDAGVSIIKLIDSANCNTITKPLVKIYNYGIDTLKSFTINYKIDANPLQTFNWTGSLATCQFTFITLNSIGPANTGSHTFIVYLTNPNGSTDNYVPNDTAIKNFNRYLDAGVTIQTPTVGYSSTNTSLSPEIILHNYGTDTLKSCTIMYRVDGAPLKTYNWTGILPPCQSFNITLMTIDQLTYDTHTLKVYSSNPNGSIDYLALNDTATRDFNVFHIYGADFNSSFSIYPSPNNGSFIITSNLEQVQNVTIKVVDVIGAIVFSTVLEDVSINSYSIDTNIPASGMYFVEIIGTDEKIVRKINVIKSF